VGPLQPPKLCPLWQTSSYATDDKTIDLLLNTCPEIECDLPVPERTGSHDEAASVSLFLRIADIPKLNRTRRAVFYVLNKLIIKI